MTMNNVMKLNTLFQWLNQLKTTTNLKNSISHK